MLLLLTVSCAVINPKVTAPVEPFSESFYAVKDLNFRDIEKLQSINNSAPTEQSAAAGLILGRHYVKKGQYNQGIKYLEANYKETYISRYMRYSGMLWLFDAYSKSGNENKALEYYTMVSNRKEEEPFPSIIRAYCSSENIRTDGRNPFVDCVDSRLSKGKITPIIDDTKKTEGTGIETTPEKESKVTDITEPSGETLKEKGKPLTDKVFLIGATNMEFMQAAVIAIGNKKSQIKLEMGDGFAFSSAKVDPFTKTVFLKSNTYNFDINRKEIADATVAHILNDKTITVLASSNEYSAESEEAKLKLRESGVTVHTINFEKGSFENEMKSIANKYSETTKITVLVLAPESKLIKVVPLVRYSVKKPERMRIIIGTDSFGHRYLNDEYGSYFRRAYVYTPVYLVDNAEAAAFRETYMNYYGQEPVLMAYIANDIISFINGEPANMSTTAINHFKSDKAVRYVKGYRILSVNNIEPVGY